VPELSKLKISWPKETTKYIKIIITGRKRHNIAAPQTGWNYAVHFLNKVSWIQQFVHYVSGQSDHLSLLTSSSRHILVTWQWNKPLAVFTWADRSPLSSPVNTSITQPIGQLLQTTLSSAKSNRAPICTFCLHLIHFGLLWRVCKYSCIHLFQ